MNLKDLNIEKVALAVLIIFIITLFLDYIFKISFVISHFYSIKIETNQQNRLIMLVSISVVPILQFLSKCTFDRKQNNEPDVLVNSIIPFLAFISGYYIYNSCTFFKSVEGLILIVFIQLILSLTIITTLQLLLSKFIKWFNELNKKI